MTNTCPHCGAPIREHARFCTACMTTLNDKRVIPTPKTSKRRWLPMVAAVLVLVPAVVWSSLPQAGVQAPIRNTPTGITSDDTVDRGETGTTGAAGTTGTGEATRDTTGVAAPTQPTSGDTTPSSVGPSTVPRYPGIIYMPAPTTTTTRSEPTQTTQRTYATEQTTRYNSTTTTTTTKRTVTTTKPTTTATRPIWLDAAPTAVTEDGLPIEEVQWEYMHLDAYSYYADKTTLEGIPYSDCVAITGLSSTTSNGIYFVPATIEGKPVVSVSFFNEYVKTEENLARAKTVKRVYLPPGCEAFGGVHYCYNLERVYITSKGISINSECIPNSTISDNGINVFKVIFYFQTYCQDLRAPGSYLREVCGYSYAMKGMYPVRRKGLFEEDVLFFYGGGEEWTNPYV